MHPSHTPSISLVIAALLLAACTTTAPVAPPAIEPPALDTPDACGAAALQNLVGQDAAVVMAMTFAAPTRIIRPGMAVTMDYNPDRLNIEIDAKEKISRITCG